MDRWRDAMEAKVAPGVGAIHLGGPTLGIS